MEALSISFPPLNSPSRSNTDTYSEQSTETGSKKYQITSTSLEEELYASLLEICESRFISVSKLIGDALNEYLMNVSNGSEELKFRTKSQIQSKKLKGLKKTGVGLEKELYLKLKFYSDAHDTSMSEVMRAVTYDYISRNFPEHMVHKEPKRNGNGAKESDSDGFVMYIDLG